MTPSRIAAPNGTFAVTRRTNERKLFWTPASAEVQRGYRSALAGAQRAEGLLVDHGVRMGNYAQTLVTPTEATNLGAPSVRCDRESARFLQEHLLRAATTPRRRSGMPGPPTPCTWRRGRADPDHPLPAPRRPGAGLVARASDWAGWLSPLSLLRGGTLVVDEVRRRRIRRGLREGGGRMRSRAAAGSAA